jgi:hypothetical protein
MNKIHYTLISLFFILFLILAINPSLFDNLYSSILGRLILISGVVYIASNSITLGLLAVLLLVILYNLYYNKNQNIIEKYSNINKISNNINDYNITNESDKTGVVDLIHASNNVKPKSSKEIPIFKNKTNMTKVQPYSENDINMYSNFKINN